MGAIYVHLIQRKYIMLISIILLCFFITFFVKADVNNEKDKSIKPKVRFAVVDKTEILTTEQKEEILEVYSNYEDNSSIQIALLIVNSPDEALGNRFLADYSGWAEKRLVIRLVTSKKEVGLFWTEALNNSLQNISTNYRAKFEPYLSEGKLYEAALYGSLEMIKMLSPDYKLP
jgi:hypothetical protein